MVKFNFGLGNDDSTNGEQNNDPQNITPAAGTTGTTSTQQDDNTSPVQDNAQEGLIPPTSSIQPESAINFNMDANVVPLPPTESVDTASPLSPEEPPAQAGTDVNFSEELSAPITTPEAAPLVPDFSATEAPQETLETPQEAPVENTPAFNPFQSPEPEATETPPLNINPFATPEQAPIAPVTTEANALETNTSSDTSDAEDDQTSTSEDPIPSLEGIKKGIISFVQAHFDNIKSYKKQINELKDKIRKEEDILRSKKNEFNALVKEIKNLAETFDENLSGATGPRGKNNSSRKDLRSTHPRNNNPSEGAKK